jgi:hypothetical protein
LRNVELDELSPEISELFDRYERKDFLSPDNVVLNFPVFAHNYDYLNRILFLTGKKLETFGLAFLDLSHLAEEIELENSNKKSSKQDNKSSDRLELDGSDLKSPLRQD